MKRIPLSRLMVLLPLLLHLIVIIAVVAAWDISVTITQEAAVAVGGEPFQIQPIIAVRNKKGILQTSILGTISAELIESPSGYEVLRRAGDGGDNGSNDGSYSVDVIDGEATFTDLYINEAGSGYLLRYIFRDEYGLTLGYVDSDSPIEVTTGDPYQIAVTANPGRAYGGVVFGDQPAVGVKDRGGNHLVHVNTGQVTVELVATANDDDATAATLLHAEEGSGDTVSIENGLAVFGGLYIAKAGLEHNKLRFTTNLSLDGAISCESIVFTVGIGPPHELVVVTDASSATVTGGRAFSVPPRIEIIDAGKNVLDYDYSSFIKVEIYNNPSEGTLSPKQHRGTFAPVVGGVAQFNNLSIDRIGVGYRLLYTLFESNEYRNALVPTEVQVLGDYFDVGIGSPHRIEVLREPSATWAGNQPFLSQPRIGLVDAGGNIVSTDSTTTSVQAYVTPSLAVSSQIVIDTTQDPVPMVLSVDYIEAIRSASRVVYGSGDVLSIEIVFTHDVVVELSTSTADDSAAVAPLSPSLELNVVDIETYSTTSYAQAILNNDNIGIRINTLLFDFEVQPHHSEASVNYRSPTTSLKTNDFTVNDAFGRAVDIQLPLLNLVASRDIALDSSPAFIQGVSLDYVSAGSYEFGAGQLMQFYVSFSREVTVRGSPQLPLNVRSTVIVVETAATEPITSSSSFVLEYRDASTRDIPWDASSEFIKFELERLATVKGDVCVSRSQSTSPHHGYRWAIRFDGLTEDPSLDLFVVEGDGMGMGMGLGMVERVSMDVSVLTLSAPMLGWSFDGGDTRMCAGRTATYKDGSGSSVLTFEYLSMQGDGVDSVDVTSDLDGAIMLPLDSDAISAITNHDASLAVAADLALGNNRLSDDVIITIDTSPPSVVGVKPASATADGTYAVGDSLFFEVSFTKPVRVSKGLELLLSAGGHMPHGVARYVSGSGSDTLIMQYEVSEGESSSDLNYVASNALIARNGDVGGHVRQVSTIPVTDASLDLPSLESGNALSDVAKIEVDGARPKVIRVAFHEESEGKTFIEREEIGILVEFTAPVVVFGGPPALLVVVGGQERRALYEAGNGSASASLRFVYTTTVGDLCTSAQDFAYKRLCLSPSCNDSSGDPISSIKRQSSRPFLDADLHLPSFGESLADGRPIADNEVDAVSIDATNPSVPTRVVGITTSHEDGTYGPGEEIRFHVEFSDIVYVEGEEPKICTNLGASANLAVPYEGGSGTNTLTFRHLVTEDDSTVALAWAICPDSGSAIDCTDVGDTHCSIRNAVGEDFDPSFDDVAPLGAVIEIDTTPPSIVSIFASMQRSQNCFENNALRPSLDLCIYTAGDTIDIVVTFDSPIVVSGPGLSLQLSITGNNDYGNVRYARFDPEQSSETELVFVYEIQVGDTTSGDQLSYVCEPLDCTLTTGSATVLRMATYPTMPANLNLPLPSPDDGISLDADNPILIDASVVPAVVEVSCLSEDGIYAPGDAVQIVVKFSEPVVVDGMVFLALDGGAAAYGDITEATATFLSGSGSTDLVFEYTVEEGHTSFGLDYVDVQSLNLDQYENGSPRGSIKFASANPTIEANLLLPPPTSPGSISATSNIVIDSRIPHIASLTSPQSPGIYVTGDVISILVEFSVPVVVTGSPYILLETGTIDRRADYVGINDSTTLEFQYIVQLGDESLDLDYWTDEGLFRSSVSSFRLNGGTIMRKSASPVVRADLHLNPGHGFLDGTTSILYEEGTATYSDLKIGKRGDEYMLRFRSRSAVSLVDFEAALSVSVGTSSEYEIIGEPYDRNSGDHFGASVAVDGDLLAIGAPGKRLPTPEVQVLTVMSDAEFIEEEIQVISTEVNVTEATKRIYSFTSSADPGQAVMGTFTISLHRDSASYLIGSLIDVEADVGAAQLETMLENSLPSLGDIVVNRSPNADCVCSNAWTWEITFLDVSNDVNAQLDVDGAGLSGEGATMSDTVLLRDTTMIGGSFYIRNPYNEARSRDIPFDASDVFMKDVIETDLDIAVKNVLVVDTDDYGRGLPELGRRWTVIFANYQGQYGEADVNVPNLEAYGVELTGSDALVWAHTALEGRMPLAGHLALSLRGSQLSNYIPHDASADEVKVALESLESVNTVTVSARSDIGSKTERLISGSSWTVTFHSVNHNTDYGWVVDPGAETSGGNLPAMEVDSRLIGWNATYLIEHEYGSGSTDTQAQWMEKKKGDAGLDSGAVYVHYKESEQWKRESTIVASDYSSFDRFGHSVDLKGTYLLVGAPSKTVNGLPEQQSLKCTGIASSGYFSISFRGFTSDPIPHDATIHEIETAVVGLYGETTRIHPLPRIDVQPTGDWDSESDAFCASSSDAAHEILFTFVTPDGGGISTEAKVSGDIEMMVTDDSHLEGGSLSVREARKGTRSPMGVDLNQSSPTGKAAGCVYLFQRVLISSDSEIGQHYTWNQQTNFTPMSGFDDPNDSAQFGWSVSLGGNSILAIGSPGYANQSGKVYLFTSTGSGSDWRHHGSLTSELWTSNLSGSAAGDMFGEAIHIQGDTILVGAPGYADGNGVVYVFRQGSGGDFLPSQAIYPPPDLSSGSLFGHSLSLSDNTAAICAPEASDKVIHAGHLAGVEPSQGVGSCFVYSRDDSSSPFILSQKLVASNLLPGDRFGYSVALAVSGRRLVVGQLERYGGSLDPPRPVQSLEVRCNLPSCANVLNPVFQLSWQSTSHESEQIQTSRLLPIHASSIGLRDALEQDLSTASVTVDRVPLIDGSEGYKWTITFDSFSKHCRSGQSVPVLSCQVREPKLSCTVNVEKGFPQNIRGKAHVFTLGRDERTWTEQAFLYPHSPQRQDMLGASVAVDADLAVVGASNRETLNINSGSAFAHDISFLNLSFDSSETTVVEGNILEVPLSMDVADAPLIVGVMRMERNIDDFWLNYLDNLFSFRSSEQFTPGRTSIDLLTHTTAYGGREEARSGWVDGFFDYSVTNETILIDKGQSQSSVLFKSINDHIYEGPDGENTTIQVHLPGMFPSQIGNLSTAIVIKDDISTQARTYYDKLIRDDARDGDGSGLAIDIDEEYLIAGGKGMVDILFRRERDWSYMTTLISPDPSFGAAVAINKPYGRADTTVLTGAPDQTKAFVYVLDGDTASWTLQGTLLPFRDTIVSVRPEHGFGKSIALSGDIAFASCASLETVYAYKRRYSREEEKFEWVPWKTIRSNEFDFDVYHQSNSGVNTNRQEGFGSALASNRRTVLIGAPFAGNGKGEVYVFSSKPHVQQIVLRSDEVPKKGSFRLKLSEHPKPATTGISGLLPHNATPSEMKHALEEAVNIGEVHVSFESNLDGQRPDKFHGTWLVSFMSEVGDDLPLLEPMWSEQIEPAAHSTFTPQIDVTTHTSQGDILQETKLQADDPTHANGFGTSLALNGEHAIIAAPQSSAIPRTTFDFETGTLVGWVAEGRYSWQNQPTFGDNSIHRPSYRDYDKSRTSGNGQSSSIQGRYYVSTYENRPGNDQDYLAPDPHHPEGSIQGDEPTGTLTSDPFMILGEEISFLIGGGCDHLTVYVELLVDSAVTIRATGKCREGMHKVTWDVSDYEGRAGQIRIVDASKEKWGHINVDDIQFSWDIYESMGPSDMAGAAYLFRRECSPSCTWVQEQRIVASDKRPGSLFGVSVHVDDDKGIALVGSQAMLSPYPQPNPTMKEISENLEDYMRTGDTQSASSGSVRLMGHIISENKTILADNEAFSTQLNQDAGAVYIFTRKKDESESDSLYWSVVEDAKTMPPDIQSGDRFGYSVALSGLSAAIGAPGVDSKVRDGGAAYFYDVSGVFVRFAQNEFVATEDQGTVKIFLERDVHRIDTPISIGYSVSDISARGVDTAKFNDCMKLDPRNRSGCGDYEQTSGTITFPHGSSQVYFTVRIVSDDVYERNLEYAQILLHVPGGGPLIGEQYRAKLRIDDAS